MMGEDEANRNRNRGIWRQKEKNGGREKHEIEGQHQKQLNRLAGKTKVCILAVFFLGAERGGRLFLF